MKKYFTRKVRIILILLFTALSVWVINDFIRVSRNIHRLPLNPAGLERILEDYQDIFLGRRRFTHGRGAIRLHVYLIDAYPDMCRLAQARDEILGFLASEEFREYKEGRGRNVWLRIAVVEFRLRFRSEPLYRFMMGHGSIGWRGGSPEAWNLDELTDFNKFFDDYPIRVTWEGTFRNGVAFSLIFQEEVPDREIIESMKLTMSEFLNTQSFLDLIDNNELMFLDETFNVTLLFRYMGRGTTGSGDVVAIYISYKAEDFAVWHEVE